MNLKQKRVACYRYLCDKLVREYRFRGLLGAPTVEAEQIINNMHDLAIQRIFKNKNLRCYVY